MIHRARADLHNAPRDRNVLIRTITRGYNDHTGNWDQTGYQWVEAYWKEEADGRPAEFVEFCGTKRISTTRHLEPVHWAELPT